MGNAARKARKRDGTPYEKPAKAPTTAYRTKEQSQEERRRDRRAAERAARMVPLIAAAARSMWSGRR